MNNQQGAGLAEIMISLLLASLLMTALMNHYISMKRQYNHLQTALDEAMELQLASDFMRDSIRQAGFTPCLNLDRLNIVDHREGGEPVMAINVSHKDLRINRMSPYFDVVTDISSPTHLLITHKKTLHVSHPILIADCYHAEIHRLREVNGQQITLEKPLAFTYQPPIYIGEWVQERFFVRPQGGLFYQREHTDELTSLVKTMSAGVRESKNTLVQNRLGLNGGRTLELVTRVRSP